MHRKAFVTLLLPLLISNLAQAQVQSAPLSPAPLVPADDLGVAVAPTSVHLVARDEDDENRPSLRGPAGMLFTGLGVLQGGVVVTLLGAVFDNFCLFNCGSSRSFPGPVASVGLTIGGLGVALLLGGAGWLADRMRQQTHYDEAKPGE